MPASPQHRFRIVETSAGPTAFVTTSAGVCRIYLPAGPGDVLRATVSRDYAAASACATLLPEFAAALRAYFAGEFVEFEVALDYATAPPFHHRVWEACRTVPYGQTTTYRELAVRVGVPGAARAVGNAMRTNRFPPVVPCHRVLRSDGGLGGFSGGDGVPFKQRLLEMERARVTELVPV